MSKIDEIIEYNKHFVEDKKYEEFVTTRYPNKKIVIVTCMDTRLVELLPKAMNLRNGDAKFIKNAGAIVTQPFGNIMRSILIAVYELQAEEVIIIGHHECGMASLNSEQTIQKMKERGISEDVINTLTHSGLSFSRWLKGFDSVKDSVIQSVQIVRNHPLLAKDVAVHGMIVDPKTGELEVVVDGSLR